MSSAYISASANRHNQAASISSKSLVAFGSSKLVALWDSADEDDHGIFATLSGHEGLVTCTQFLRDDAFVSADDKGVVHCWRYVGHQWQQTGTMQAHSKAVSALCFLDDYLVTGGSDASVKVWKIIPGDTTDELKEVQKILLNGRYPLSLAMEELPQSKAIILAISSTDRNVQIWVRSEDLFVRAAVLSGHEDWVRSLAFRAPSFRKGPLVLASGSQDGTIRLWNIETFSRPSKPSQLQEGAAMEPLSDDFLDAFEASLGDLADAEEGGRQISLKRHILTIKSDQGGSQQYSITFDALLVGHDAGITSLSWRPDSLGNAPSILTLLSTSTDSSLILWSPSSIMSSSSPDGSTSIWINRQRFGDIGGQRLGGFVGGLWAQGGRDAMAWGWSGGWRRWRSDGKEPEHWEEAAAISGHNGPVKGLDWSPKGEYLISAGLDQTTRIHGAIPNVRQGAIPSWHEVSRPQVHGYDLLNATFLDALKFVSIADEKVARVFEAPRGFIHVVNGLKIAELQSDESERPLGASVPPLGLSNKALGASDPGGNVQELSGAVRRPFEGELASVTLWPEVEKVFGHGYESMSLAVSNSRRFVATACKATTAEHAVVRVYDTDKWQLYGRVLEGHSLTVTRIAFSPNDRFVLSVSRDRTWRLFEDKDGTGFVPVAADKSHARIIWDCAWTLEGDAFATASRDKTVRIWRVDDKDASEKWAPVATLVAKEAITAIAFAAADLKGKRRLAVGLETGGILIYTGSQTDLSKWKLDATMDSRIGHGDHINQMAWRPPGGSVKSELATCSEDGTLKVLIVPEE
ncbi:WD40 repeat-like protein [Athelia psychrophila]|uniref:Elongator complex protein 2 n=1 Tax=Athelia psychrophila TaxID=1759441 RepID=A0A166VLW2_9AGAM|nr:WD40 repeat-like protein [Fibularhizoctonia sp. CBS 109695]